MRTTLHLPGYPAAQQLSNTQSLPRAEYIPSCTRSPKSPRKWNPGRQGGPPLGGGELGGRRYAELDRAQYTRLSQSDLWCPGTDAWGPTGALSFTWHSRRLSRDVEAPPWRVSSSHRCLPHWANECPAESLRLSSSLCPRPTPLPPKSKVSQLYSLRMFSKSPLDRWELRADDKRSKSADARGPQLSAGRVKRAA